ncbi:hypothetical protein [Bacillus suaedae]|uniref:Uncharacterized protein n=1 Tax=Halalkalibacter suaedae TaxID=2822140 RepID=A0A940WYI2_9BACI|nr:hypothetical protein [Bacillus suaedae]MBP3953122.1 hypothetical protein [Bacillus suaedae]
MDFYLVLLVFSIPVTVAVLLIWVYRIKKNSETQLEQNERIIQLLEKRSKE